MLTSRRIEATGLAALLLMVAVLAAGTATTPGPVPPIPEAGPLHASAPSPIVFLNTTPWNGEWISSKSPVIIVLYADVLGPSVTVTAATFVLDGLGFNTSGLFNNTVFHVFVPFELSNGPHAARLTLQDSVGSTNTTAWSFTVFAVPPILVVAQPAATFVLAQTVLVEGVAAPPVPYPRLFPVRVTIAPRPGSSTIPATVSLNGSFSQAVPLVSGLNTLFVNATDAIGNTATVLKAVFSNGVPPILTILTPQNLNPITGSGIFERSVVHVSGITKFGAYLTVNNLSVAVNPDGDWSIDLALPDGVDLITVVAADLAGNVYYDGRVVLVDTDLPRVVLTAPVLPVTNRHLVTVSGYATDAHLALLLVNGESTPFDPATGAFSRTLSLPDGTWPIVVVAVDAARNTGTALTGVLVDTTAPVVRLTSPPDGLETNQSSVVVSGTVDDANATVLVNHQQIRPSVDGGWRTTVALIGGANAITVSAVDEAGNRASSVTVTATYFPATPDLNSRIAQNARDLAVWTGTVTLGLLAVLVLLLVALFAMYLRLDHRIVRTRRIVPRAVAPRKPTPAPPTKEPEPEPPKA